jgi:hypothetical protein
MVLDDNTLYNLKLLIEFRKKVALNILEDRTDEQRFKLLKEYLRVTYTIDKTGKFIKLFTNDDQESPESKNIKELIDNEIITLRTKFSNKVDTAKLRKTHDLIKLAEESEQIYDITNMVAGEKKDKKEPAKINNINNFKED